MVLPDLHTALRHVGGDLGKAAALARAAAAAVRPVDPPYHAFISVDPDPKPSAERRSDALLGCVFSVKDNIDVAGVTTTCGSAMLADAPPAASDAWIVKALKRAGAVCIGKNHMHEFALGATGVSPLFGTTVNPWDQSRGAGGSSGGGANAVALRQVHLSLGTDSGGSVRMPASFTGITGFKPTPGVLPMEGVAGESWTLDCLGLFTPTVAELRTIWQALVEDEPAPQDRPPRLACLADDSMGRVDPVVWAQYQATLQRLRDGGLALEPISITGFDICPYLCISIVYPEVASWHHELLREKPALYDQHIRALISLGELWSARHYIDAQRLKTVMRDRLKRLIEPYDAILTPTVAIRPVPVGQSAYVEGDAPDQSLYTLIRFTVILNVTGYPGISVPSGLDPGGLPTGLQLFSRPGEDARLLQLAQRVEDILGTMSPPPGA
jgi:aspartyl-tRNA(Asn)/glutamyl-tRNA(Gln) amidotransferase subunit A